jgi:sigma-B regulation protein RsbU (phosphoserine phosphatase)
MGLVQGVVRASGTTASPLDHEQAAERLNRFLCGKTANERFVTLFWCYFNANEGILRYINAGHWPPLLMRGGAHLTEVLRLERAGPVLGVVPGASYEQAEVAVQSGDLLVVYSDGILEASDSQEQEFGEERLIAAAQRNWSRSPLDICEAILADVQSFVGQEVPKDDQTLLVARLEPKQGKAIASAEVTAVQVLHV